MIVSWLRQAQKGSMTLNLLAKQRVSVTLMRPLNIYEFAYSKNRNKQSSQSLLKHYFSSRLSLSKSQLQGFIVDLSKNGDVKIRDHRWQNLYMTIEKYQREFSLSSKVQILKALGRMKQDNLLYQNLYRSIAGEFHHLTIDQISDVIWSMVRVKHNDKALIMAVYKKLHQVVNQEDKILLYKQNETLPLKDSLSSSVNDQQTQQIHHMYDGSFVRLIWALQKTTIVDSKLLMNLLKKTLQGKENANMQKIRIQNLCLLAYCIFQIKIQKYRIADNIISSIMKQWEELTSLSTLSLSLLCETFSKSINNKNALINKYEKDLTPEELESKLQNLQREKKFFYLVIETIFLRQDQDVKTKNRQKKSDEDVNDQIEGEKLRRLRVPLSSKFASKILYNLARVGMYNKQIWFKLLNCITNDVDRAEALDLSMSLCAVCDFCGKDFIPQDEYKSMVYEQKKIITRRMFQIYQSLNGRTLQILKEFVWNKQIQKEFIPTWIRKQLEKELMNQRAKREDQLSREQSTNFQNSQQKNQQKRKQSSEKIQNDKRSQGNAERKQYPDRRPKNQKQQNQELGKRMG